MKAFRSAAAVVRETSHDCRDVELASLDLDRARRTIFALCEIEMARVHGDRLRRSPDDFSPLLASFLAFGARQTGTDVDRFEKRFAGFQAASIDLFRDLDVLVLPTTPQAAFRHEEAPPANNADFTCLASATGMPALTMPLPHAAGELPAGLQLVGRPGLDYALISVAAELESGLNASG
jgi:aspartyl-tRNA(Asn)/glutamyl-tRNA(Gln) amidotransferase subunit A